MTVQVLICMPSMYALYVCLTVLTCMPYMPCMMTVQVLMHIITLQNNLSQSAYDDVACAHDDVTYAHDDVTYTHYRSAVQLAQELRLSAIQSIKLEEAIQVQG